MELLTIFLRTIVAYFVVFLAMRLMGKREIGKLSVFDLVISIMIAELAVLVVEDAKKNLMSGLLPMMTLVVIQILMAYVTLKSKKLRDLFEGSASPIIKNGKINDREMGKQRYSIDDLMIQLRENNVPNPADVEFASLETTGKLTVIDKNDGYHYERLPIPLIMDGKVQDKNLQEIGKTRFWLKNQVQAHGVMDFKDVFLCTVDHKGLFYLDEKDRKK